VIWNLLPRVTGGAFKGYDLEEEERKTVSDALKRKNKNASCDFCYKCNYELVDKIIIRIKDDNPYENSYYNAFLVACSFCGKFTFFDPKVLMKNIDD